MAWAAPFPSLNLSFPICRVDITIAASNAHSTHQVFWWSLGSCAWQTPTLLCSHLEGMLWSPDRSCILRCPFNVKTTLRFLVGSRHHTLPL